MNDREKFIITYTWLNTSFPDWSSKKRISTLILFSQYLCPSIKIPEMEETLVEISDVLLEMNEINNGLIKKQENHEN